MLVSVLCVDGTAVIEIRQVDKPSAAVRRQPRRERALFVPHPNFDVLINEVKAVLSEVDGVVERCDHHHVLSQVGQ